MTGPDRLRVAFLTPWRTDDEAAWSGIIAPMVRALGGVADVVPVSTHDVGTAFLDRALARGVGSLTHRTYLWDFGLATARRRGRTATQRTAAVKADVVFAVAASVDLAYLGCPDVPVVQYVDATFESIRDRYPVFANVSRLSAAQVGMIGRRADHRTSRFVAASSWARDALARDHAVGTETITVAPPGAAIEPTTVAARPTSGPLHALVVSTDWVRKGGTLAVDAARIARAQGADVRLTVVGDCPADLPHWVQRRGRVDRHDMSAEYFKADVLLELARANAAGVTLTDAAAHGLPAIATATMGVPSIVRTKQSGWLVDPAGDAVGDAARILVDTARHADRADLAARARAWYDDELAWPVWAERVRNACGVAAHRQPATVR